MELPDGGGIAQPGDADGFAEFQRGEAGGDDVAGVHRGYGQAGGVDAGAVVELGGDRAGAARLDPDPGSGQFPGERGGEGEQVGSLPPAYSTACAAPSSSSGSGALIIGVPQLTVLSAAALTTVSATFSASQ
jgi:hypothetical protein